MTHVMYPRMEKANLLLKRYKFFRCLTTYSEWETRIEDGGLPLEMAGSLVTSAALSDPGFTLRE